MNLRTQKGQAFWSLVVTAAASFTLGYGITRYLNAAPLNKFAQLGNYQPATGRIEATAQGIYLNFLEAIGDLHHPNAGIQKADSFDSYRPDSFVQLDS